MPNWWARAAFERTSISVVEFGVEVEVRRASRVVVGAGIACGCGSGVGSLEFGAMSPGATGGLED